MLLPDYLDSLPDSVVALFRQVEEGILEDMARRLLKTESVTDTAQWQAWRLEQLGETRQAIRYHLQRLTGKTQGELNALFQAAGGQALYYDDQIYRAAGLTPGKVNDSPALLNLLRAGARQTHKTFQNLTQTTANTATQQFERALDRAWLQISSGAFDYQTAIRRAIKDLALAGLQSITYPTGHTDALDVAVRRAVLTGVNQTAARLSEARAEEMGCDLVETTAHPGARPEHVKWQGKVFSRSGKSRKYPDFVRSTGYGTGPGLCGWNCRHSFFPYFEGLSESAYPRSKLREYEEKTVKYNGKTLSYYDATQQQRYIERQIRRWKREYLMLDAAGMDTTQASVKLAQWRATERDFCKQSGLDRDGFRSQAEGFGRSQAAKALSEAKQSRAYEKFYVESGGSFLPPTLAEFRQMRYTDFEEWRLNMEAKKLFDKIDQTESYSDEYRKKLKQAYTFFRERGFAFREHALNRFLGQKNSKGKFHFTEDELLEILRKDCNYAQADGKNIRYYNGIAVVSAEDTGEIISIVVRGKPKSDWRELHDQK